MSDALIVFAKPPDPGLVKTRLHTLLTAPEAALLYRAFLADSLDQYRALGRDVFLYLTEVRNSEMDTLDLSGVVLCRQEGADLAERLQRAFVDVFALGHERVVVIGTDHPSLPSAFVERAFEELQVPGSIVLGPAEDGGYYLLGMNDFRPILFEEMDFSHGRVLEDTLERAGTTNANVAVLPEWYDVDTADQLPRLWRDLRDARGHAPRTMDVLERLLGKYDQMPGIRQH